MKWCVWRPTTAFRAPPPLIPIPRDLQPEIVHRKGTLDVPSVVPRNVRALQARAETLANSQLASTGQTCFTLYMFIGAQLTLIGVYMMLTSGTTPVRNLLNMHQTFTSLEAPGVSLLLPKLKYAVINGAGAAFLVWKLMTSGLLPVVSGDWFTMLPTKVPLEQVGLSFDATA